MLFVGRGRRNRMRNSAIIIGCRYSAGRPHNGYRYPAGRPLNVPVIRPNGRLTKV